MDELDKEKKMGVRGSKAKMGTRLRGSSASACKYVPIFALRAYKK